MFLLDTNVVSELRKRDKGDRNVMAWSSSVSPNDLYLSAITVMELEIGALRKARFDPAQGALLNIWITERVLPQFKGRILPIDEAVALCCARLHVPDPRSERDALIAATAIHHDMTVVTRNTADFERTGVRLFDPWQGHLI
ncbi:type II toxin-antitoxin system VapC family toxin [Chitinimonas lacunae]|uniref:Ribonuclease VapC n=1 Tax=Chitinimonas lacunae TaxID=1963018 RepID=A0ABV8MLR2_9NEIS